MMSQSYSNLLGCKPQLFLDSYTYENMYEYENVLIFFKNGIWKKSLTAVKQFKGKDALS